jgi:hypothetical protein
VQSGTKWIGDIQTSFLERRMRERLNNELEALKQQQQIMKDELYEELRRLKLEQELQLKKDQLYAELKELKSKQMEMIHESIAEGTEESTDESMEWEQVSVNSYEETIKFSPQKAVSFQEDVLESGEEEFYY